MARADVFHFSPSEHHQHLMDGIEQSHAYTGGDVAAWQRRLKPVVKRLLGDWPAERGPLNVRSIYTKEHEFGTIEKIVFTSEPYADVPAWVCIPEKWTLKGTWMICVQGHSSGAHNSVAVERDDERKPQETEGDRDFALECMRNGVAAVALEQRAFGLRREMKMYQVEKVYCQDAAMQALHLGRTLIGERIFDIDRAIDYLHTRTDVNKKRIGVMGNSGGGTASLFAAAMLPRLAFAMPSCYFNTFRDSIMSINHCVCNYVPGLLKYAEMSDIMGLFAPKPVVIVAGKEDTIFPIKATRKAFKELIKIYTAAGAADRCRLVEGAQGHRFYADDAWPVLLRLLEKM